MQGARFDRNVRICGGYGSAGSTTPAPVWNWTGWYAGVNLGASFGNVKTDFNATPVTGVINVGPSSFTTPGFAGSNREYPDGFMGGGQIGYNWQFSPIWVVGLEADFQGAAEKDHNTLTNSFSGVTTPISGPPTSFNFPVTASTVLDYSTQIDWFGTVRVRAGYVWGNGNVFSYVTGGLAYGEVKINGTSTVSGTVGGPPAVPFSITHSISHSQVNAGWAAGYGTEGRLGNSNWTWKVEGLYMGLGTIDDTDAIRCAAPGCTVTSLTGGQTITHTRFIDGILRGGLNYKFY
jgi:outer membrane immunogenic protein